MQRDTTTFVFTVPSGSRKLVSNTIYYTFIVKELTQT